MIYQQKYKPNTEINFKNSGIGIVLGWAAGTIGGVALSTKKAVDNDFVLPAFLDSLVILLSGISGGYLGYLLEKLIRKK